MDQQQDRDWAAILDRDRDRAAAAEAEAIRETANSSSLVAVKDGQNRVHVPQPVRALDSAYNRGVADGRAVPSHNQLRR